MTTRCAIYCRVSTKKQSDSGTSLETQEQRCRTYAAEQGWTVVAVESEQQSGMHRHRPGLLRLRAMVRSGQTDVLLAYDPDRLSRLKRLTRELADECVDHDVDLDFVTSDYDDTLEGELRRDIDGYVNQKEHAKICERTSRARRARVEGARGLPGMPLPGRRPILGYEWADAKKSKLVVSEPAAGIVRRIFTEFHSGRSLHSIAQALTDEGVPTPTGRGKRWGKPTIRVILKQPAYVGDYRALRYERTETKGVRSDKRGKAVAWMVLRPENETVVLPNVAPALIDRATWDDVQARLDGLAEFAARPLTREQEALLRGGYALCAHCSSPLVCSTHHGKLVYKCGKRLRKETECPQLTVRAEVLDPLVWHRVLRFLNDPELIRVDVERLRRNDPTEAETDRLDKLIAGHEEQRANFLRAIAAAESPAVITTLVARLESLTTDVEGWEADKEELRSQRAGWEAAAKGLDDLSGFLTAYHRDRQLLLGNPTEYDYGMKRAWLGWLGVQVRVKRTFPGQIPKGRVLDRITRVDDTWVENQPYEIVARVPLGELPGFAVGGTTDSSVP